jgi:TolB-like protein/DNA-binding winged helix-turn-helix (wHTH) protein/Tfp pilus assembly protein PilF
MEHEISTNSSEILFFDKAQYDKPTGRIFSETGSEVHIRPQSARVLSLLAERTGLLVTREDIVNQVWADAVTTDDSLTQCIANIRRALGKGAVETYPKKGYALKPTEPENAGVRSSAENFPGTKKQPLRAYYLSAAAISIVLLGLAVFSLTKTPESQAIDLPAISTRNTIAVLPFTDLSNNAELDYFRNGLAEDLTTGLSKVPGLTVIAYASSVDFPNAESGFKSIATELGVRYLVRGTVRQNANRVRVTVSLVDPYDGFNLWAEKYDRPRHDSLYIQDEVASEIVTALSLEFNIENTLPPRVEPDAYDMLLRGLDPMRSMTKDGNFKARDFFERALKLDPEYARANASIAITYAREPLLQGSPMSAGKTVTTGLEYAVKAIQLDPELPHAYLALGLLNLSVRKFDTALSATRHALKLDRNFSEGYALLAEVAMYGGNLSEALSAIQRARVLHPKHPATYYWLEANIHYLMGNYALAAQVRKETTPENFIHKDVLLTYAANEAQMGNIKAAKEIVRQLEALIPNVTVQAFIQQLPYRSPERSAALLSGIRKTRDAD